MAGSTTRISPVVADLRSFSGFGDPLISFGRIVVPDGPVMNPVAAFRQIFQKATRYKGIDQLFRLAFPTCYPRDIFSCIANQIAAPIMGSRMGPQTEKRYDALISELASQGNGFAVIEKTDRNTKILVH
jgi:hypothetical protein